MIFQISKSKLFLNSKNHLQLRLEAENLKLVEQVDVLDGQAENLEKDCIEHENKIAKTSEELREIKETGIIQYTTKDRKLTRYLK